MWHTDAVVILSIIAYTRYTVTTDIPDAVVILRDQAEESPTSSATTYIMMVEIEVWGYITEKEIKGQKWRSKVRDWRYQGKETSLCEIDAYKDLLVKKNRKVNDESISWSRRVEVERLKTSRSWGVEDEIGDWRWTLTALSTTLLISIELHTLHLCLT